MTINPEFKAKLADVQDDVERWSIAPSDVFCAVDIAHDGDVDFLKIAEILADINPDLLRAMAAKLNK